MWFLKCPAPQTGTLAKGYFNAGPILANDYFEPTKEDSKMHVLFDITEVDFDTYKNYLKELSVKITFENQLGEDKIFAFSYLEKQYHVIYFAKRGEIRITEDPSATAIHSFGYSEIGNEVTTVYQYGLYYDPENHVTDRTVNCGMLYVIKLSDNSVFMIDGGHIRQCTNEAIEGLWNFLLKITNTPEDGTIRIAGWHFTHAHDDHLNGCTKLLNRHHKQIVLERVMHNFPSFRAMWGYSISTYDMKQKVSELYPDVKTLKLHTGQKFNLSDMTVEVLYTQEEAAIKEDLSKLHIGDSNCTSSILKLTISGKTFMLLGDTSIETEEIIYKYGYSEIWKSDMVQVAHHCFNYLNTLYEWIAAPVALVTNSYNGAHQPENTPKLETVLKHVKDDQVYYEGYGTDGLVATESGWKHVEFIPLIGSEYDFSGY